MTHDLIRISYDAAFVEELKQRGTRGKFKAMAFLLYLHDTELGIFQTTRYYADVWGVSKSTAWVWLNTFSAAADNGTELPTIR